MRRLDKEIMLALLSSQQSMYGVEKSLKGTNYATVYRHIRKMQNDSLLTVTKMPRKNGRQDNRGTEKPELTTKGLATLIIDGNLQKEELLAVGRKVLKEDYGDLPASFSRDIDAAGIFASTLLKMRHKINLEFFDEAYFNKTFNISFAESLFDELRRHDFRKDTAIRAKAKKFRKKYVTSTQIESLRELRQQFIEERNKFNHYVEVIGAFLKVL